MKKLVRSGFVKANESVVLVLTGHMLKDVDYMLQAQIKRVIGPMPADAAAVIEVLERFMPEIETVTEKTEKAARPKDVVRVGIIGYGTVGRASAGDTGEPRGRDHTTHGRRLNPGDAALP